MRHLGFHSLAWGRALHEDHASIHPSDGRSPMREFANGHLQLLEFLSKQGVEAPRVGTSL